MSIARMISEKKRYRQYKARTEALPESYRTANDAVGRYLMYFGAITKGSVMLSMLEDLADLFEESASNGISIRGIVGEDPVEFAEVFLQNYTEGQWINKERERLTEDIERAAGEAAGNERKDVR